MFCDAYINEIFFLITSEILNLGRFAYFIFVKALK